MCAWCKKLAKPIFFQQYPLKKKVYSKNYINYLKCQGLKTYLDILENAGQG